MTGATRAALAGSPARDTKGATMTSHLARGGFGVPVGIRRLILALLAVACLSTPSAADLAAWDQARVTDIAQKLAAACDGFDQTVQKQQGGTLGSGSAGEVFGMQKESRAMREQSLSLAGHLKAGKGHDQTRNEYRDLKEIADDIAEEGQRSPLDEPTLDAWAKVTDLMRQIAPYYDPKAN
jgi:hypothetical protein